MGLLEILKEIQKAGCKGYRNGICVQVWECTCVQSDEVTVDKQLEDLLHTYAPDQEGYPISVREDIEPKEQYFTVAGWRLGERVPEYYDDYITARKELLQWLIDQLQEESK